MVPAINIASYIELNPIRARLVERPEDYSWSSYRSRIFGDDDIRSTSYLICFGDRHNLSFGTYLKQNLKTSLI
jgi:hypothetical protein